MNIKIINPLDFPDWNQQISRLREATIFHTSNWARVLSETYGYKPRYFCTLHKGQLQNVIPVMEISSPLTGKRGVSLPFSDRLDPLVDDPVIFKKLFEFIVEFGSSYGWKSIIFRGGDKFFRPDQSFDSYINSFIQLNGSQQTLYKKFKGSTRRNIKKAESSDLKTTISMTEESVRSFYDLNCLTRKEHGLPPQPFRFFQKIYQHILYSDNGFVCLSRHRNKPVSGVFFLHFNRAAFFKYGASDKHFLHLRPNNLSMWHAIQKCLNDNFEIIDLGRSEISHQGLIQYKRGWNATEEVINYYKYDLREKNFSTKRSNLNSSYILLKHLPLPILKAIGNTLYRHVG